MAKTKKLTAFKVKGLSNSIVCYVRKNRKITFYAINKSDNVSADNSQMISVILKLHTDIANPSQDIAALVGVASVVKPDGSTDSRSPDLWFWNDKFWIKAVDREGVPYYFKKNYLFYEVVVTNRDEIVARLSGSYDDYNEEWR